VSPDPPHSTFLLSDQDVTRVCLLCLQELYSGQFTVFAGLSTGFLVGTHVFMSLLLIVRQGWLQAATQAVGFILTLNPFENLTPIPQGIVGLFMLSVGFIAYVLIAASGGGWGLRRGVVVYGGIGWGGGGGVYAVRYGSRGRRLRWF